MHCHCKFGRAGQFEALPDRLSPHILAGLAKDEIRAVLSSARHQNFTAPSVVVHQGDAADRLFLLTSGRGAHFVNTRDGSKILLNWLTAGQIFGGAAMLANAGFYLAGTELQTDACALVWKRDAIRDLVSRFPLLLDNALSIAVYDHIAWLMAARISLSTDDAPARIARLLLSFASAIGKESPNGTEICAANEDLAAGTGLTPYTVSRVLAEWDREGIVRKGRGRLILRRPEMLLRTI